MNYTKLNKTLLVKTKEEFTSTEPTALMDFERKGIMHLPTLVPYHAVNTLTVTKTVSTETRPDPYGCKEEGSNRVCEGTVCSMTVEC